MAKRRIRCNIYGNWVGYLGRQQAHHFGCGRHAERLAAYWLKTGTVDHVNCYDD